MRRSDSDEVVGGFSNLGQRGLAVGRNVDLVSPSLEGGTDVVQDVRLIVHHQHSQLTNGNGWSFLGWRPVPV